MITDPENTRSLRAFFEEYGHLKSTDLAMLADVGMTKLRRWRDRCGYKPEDGGWGVDKDKRPFKGTIHQKVEVEKVPPEVWADSNWLRQKYESGCGIRLIARMVNRNIKTVFDRMQRLGIVTRDNKTVSKNPCCNRDWLIEHYEILGLSIRECARLAGVNRYTIYNWLVKYKIYIRDKYDLNGEHSPSYGRKMKKNDRTNTQKINNNKDGTTS
jgi:transposase-like protein